MGLWGFFVHLFLYYETIWRDPEVSHFIRQELALVILQQVKPLHSFGSSRAIRAPEGTGGVSTLLFFFPLVPVSHIFTSPSVSQVVDEDLCLTEFEKKIDVPDSYYGPRLSFPLTVDDANALLHAFRNDQVSCN